MIQEWLELQRDDLAWMLEEILAQIRTADFVSATRQECLMELEGILKRMQRVPVFPHYIGPELMDSYEMIQAKRQRHVIYADFYTLMTQIRLLYQEIRSCQTDMVYVEGVLMGLADELDKTYDWEE